MMLVINTAFMTANLALQTADGKVVLRDIDAKSKHSENVLKTIDEMCQEAKVSVLDVDTVAVVVGPGSFTGLRIGTAIAKALGCVNKNLKFVALSSLEAMAYIHSKQRGDKNDFVCAINALSNLFFVGTYDCHGHKLEEEKMIDKAQFEEISLEKVALVGDLSEKVDTEIELNGTDLLEFALLKAKKGEFVTQEELLPKYLRLSQAEDNLNKLKKLNKNS